MCMGGSKAPPPVVPATPPPPPPVLEQAAPDVSSAKVSEDLKKQASGTKQYRTSLSIGTASPTNNNTGLGINA